MKLSLTVSMLLTKKEQKRSVVLAVVIATVCSYAFIKSSRILLSNIIPDQQVQDVIELFSGMLVIIGLFAFARYYSGRSSASLGLSWKKPFKNIGIGLLTGGAFLTFVFLINLAFGSIEVSFDLQSISFLYIVACFFGYFVQGTMEEVLARGFTMNAVSAKTNIWIGIIVSSVIFTAMHGANPSMGIIPILNLFLASLILSFVFYLSDNILLAGVFHGMWNFMLGHFYGVSVSGWDNTSSILQTCLLPDMSLINGGDFGFEGGLALSIAGAITLAIQFYFVKRKMNHPAA